MFPHMSQMHDFHMKLAREAQLQTALVTATKATTRRMGMKRTVGTTMKTAIVMLTTAIKTMIGTAATIATLKSLDADPK